MQEFTVTVHYTYGTSLPQTVATMVIKRKAKDIGSAITAVSAIFNSLSNTGTVLDNGTFLPYIQVTGVSIN